MRQMKLGLFVELSVIFPIGYHRVAVFPGTS